MSRRTAREPFWVIRSNSRRLAATYGRGDAPCALGAVKTNFGHLEAAAGIAGFIKAALVVGQQDIPPNLHFSRWNSAIDPSSSRFFVPTAGARWPVSGWPRRAGVSSFGLSGTNAHVVIEQAPDVVAAPAQTAGPAVTTLVVSGKTPQRVASWASVLADWMEEPGAGVALADVAHTLNHHRPRHGRFATVCARDRAEAVAGLRALAAGQPAVGVAGPHEGLCGPGVVFVYSGQGSQWTGMGQQLLADEPAFSAAVAELEPDFVAQTGFSLQQTLAAGQPVTGIAHIQPVVVGMQLALTALWRSYGVSPDAVIGHSMGEVSAAVVAGALTPADGLRVIATRSQLMSRLSGQGAMALLELDATDTEAVIADHPEVSVAVHASPRQTVIAGPPEQVDAVIATVAAQDRLARRIDVDVASHHRIIDPVLAPLRQALSNLMPRAPTIPVLSTTYDHADTPPVFDANHWADNLRHPVRFHQAITQAAQHHHTFIEISPHPLLTHAITETVESVKPTCAVRVTSAMNRDQHETVFFHTQLAEVGVTASGVATGRLADIPHPPWQHSTFWVADRSGLGELKSTHPLLGVHMELPSGRDHVWQADVGTDVCPWLSDHKVHGQPILPAAAFIEIALAAGSEAFGLPAPALSVTQLEVEQMLPIDGHTQITTQLHHGPDGIASVEVCSRSVNDNWRRHAVARVAELQTDTPLGRRGAPVGSWDTEVSPADFYATLRKSGQHHGPAFTALTRIVRRSNGSSETEITLPEEASRHPGFRIHPVMLDAALQSIAAAMSDRTIAEAAEVSYLPVSFEEITDIRLCRSACALSRRSDGPRWRRQARKGHRDGRRRQPCGRAHGHLPSSCRTACGTATAGTEDLRHCVGAQPSVTRRCACGLAGKLACADRRYRCRYYGGRVRGPMAIADPACHHRQARRRVRGAGRLCRVWCGCCPSTCRDRRFRRRRLNRPQPSGDTRERLDLVDLLDDPGRRRRLAREIATALAGNPKGPSRRQRRDGRPRHRRPQGTDSRPRLRASRPARDIGRPGREPGRPRNVDRRALLT